MRGTVAGDGWLGGVVAVLLHQYQFVVLRQLQAVILATVADQQLAVAHKQGAGIQHGVGLLVGGSFGVWCGCVRHDVTSFDDNNSY